jgi:hypothetical protein
MRAVGFLVLAALLVSGAGPARADLLVPVSQTRTVSAEASNPNGSPSSQSFSAPDFAPWNQHAGAGSQGLGPGDVTQASASQNTKIEANEISGTFDTWALFSQYNGSGTAEGRSTLDVTFDLTEEVGYTLFPTSDGPNFFGGVDVTLSGPSGVISHFHGPGYGQGALPPGRYRLEVVVVTIQAPDYIEGHHGGTFGFTVGPPPPPPPVVPKYSLTGKFGSRRGGLLNLPLVGATPCPSHTVMSGPGGKAVPAPTTPPNRSQAQPANPLGCIPVVNGLQINQSAVAKNGTFILPAKVLQQPLPASVNWLSVPNATPLFQAQTSFAFKGPQKNAKLRASAWTTQAGRAAPDFTWCPGNPECAKITEGTKPAIVKYTAGPNRFGTTMQMVISAGPNPSRLVQAVGGGAGPVTFHPLPTGAPVTGAGYAFQQTDPAVNGSGWALHKSTAMGRISMGTGYLGPRPGNEVVNYGFPFTTGRVLVRRTGTQLGNPVVATTSAVGSDHATSMGARNLSLVAGAVALSPLGGPSLAIAQMSLPEPGPFVQQLAVAAALLAIAAWRARRRGA